MTDTRELDDYLRNPSMGVPWEIRIKIADLITALAEENQRLREALKKIASTGRCEFAEVRAVLRSTEASHD